MKIVGIVAEYNPFHNGHAWHVAQTRRQTGCDYVIACMDGHFTQRGEPALYAKWDRARMALSCGVDAVFELPALYAVRPADAFARSGVAILDGLGADGLSFGCEITDQSLLQTLVCIQENEPKSVTNAIQQGLSEGKSYPRAWGEAVSRYLDISEDLLNQPNLILATAYMRAIQALESDMEPVPVKRQGSYHSAEMGDFASASAIREAVLRGDKEQALRCIPAAARPHADAERLHPMDDLLMARLRDMSVAEMARLPDAGEGLAQRLYRLCRRTGSRAALLEAMKCKRYTHARLSRLLTHALLGVNAAALSEHPLPRYARLIGLRRGAEPLMRELTRRSRLPIAASPTELRGDAVFGFECRATDLWALLHDDPEKRLPGRELTEKFVRF